MLVEVFKPQPFAGVYRDGLGDAGNGVLLWVDSASVFVAKLKAIGMMSLHFYSTQYVLSICVFIDAATEEFIEVFIALRGEIGGSLEFKPCFALLAPFGNSSMADTVIVLPWAFFLGLRNGSDVTPVWGGGLIGALNSTFGWLLGGRLLFDGVTVTGEHVNGSYPHPNAGNGGNQHICFVIHFDPCFRLSLNSVSTRLVRSVQSHAGGAHGG
ncbi:hypothetical protein SAMN04515663_101391 [Alcanivorax sp. DSM 26293]|nr:hypothetical protein SAMN04515663_101391 [Alcanivorax sp. DSM 26293]